MIGRHRAGNYVKGHNFVQCSGPILKDQTVEHRPTYQFNNIFGSYYVDFELH